MGACDVCNEDASFETGTYYTANEFRKLVAKGYRPAGAFLKVVKAFGQSEDQAIETWKRGIVRSTTTGLVLPCFRGRIR